MDMDPVLHLAEELRGAETALRDAIRRYEVDQTRDVGETVNALLRKVRQLHQDISTTVPTSAIGASEVLRLAARRLPFSLARYSPHFHEVAERLGAGRREQADLIWLRAMRAALKHGQGGEQGQRTAPLLGLALVGASRPVVVFRALKPPPEDEDLARLLH